jgi:hypothetical protein
VARTKVAFEAHESGWQAAMKTVPSSSGSSMINEFDIKHLRKIYFDISNSLKDIARWLGFEWTWPHASGSGAILLRRCWELTRDDRLRQQLVAYNIEDCRAAEVVTGAIERICSNDNDQTKFKAVNVSALEVGFQRTFGKFSGALPEFDKINAAAYWDYQRSKVYVRTDKTIRRSIVRATKRAKKIGRKGGGGR